MYVLRNLSFCIAVQNIEAYLRPIPLESSDDDYNGSDYDWLLGK